MKNPFTRTSNDPKVTALLKEMYEFDTILKDPTTSADEKDWADVQRQAVLRQLKHNHNYAGIKEVEQNGRGAKYGNGGKLKTENGVLYKIIDLNSPMGKYKYVIDGLKFGGFKSSYISDKKLSDLEIESIASKNKYAKGSTISAKADRHYKAYEGGRHKSKKFASIEMSDGTVVKRRNANQYGDAYGGRVYTENRPNRTDRRGKSRPDAEGTAITRREANRTARKSASKSTHRGSSKSSHSKAWEYSIGGL